MVAEPKPGDEQPETDEQNAQAPTARARALRDEMLGGALTLDEVSYILGLDRTTVAKYLRENSLSGFQIGREWLVQEEALRAYVRRQMDAGDQSLTHAHRGLIERMRSDLPLFGKRRERADP